MANTQPVNDTPYITAFIREKAKAVAACHVYPIGAVTKGLKGEELAEIGGMVREGARTGAACWRQSSPGRPWPRCCPPARCL
jgi:dihydroorotase-like cyclic amidohydrolase